MLSLRKPVYLSSSLWPSYAESTGVGGPCEANCGSDTSLDKGVTVTPATAHFESHSKQPRALCTMLLPISTYVIQNKCAIITYIYILEAKGGGRKLALQNGKVEGSEVGKNTALFLEAGVKSPLYVALCPDPPAREEREERRKDERQRGEREREREEREMKEMRKR